MVWRGEEKNPAFIAEVEQGVLWVCGHYENGIFKPFCPMEGITQSSCD